MAENSNNILDQFDDEPVKRWFEHWAILYGPIGLFCIGVFFRIQHWPGASIIIAAALLLILIRSIIFFFAKRRPWHEWAYFISRLILITALSIHFGIARIDRKTMLIILSVFAAGVFTYILNRRAATEIEDEKPEDDY